MGVGKENGAYRRDIDGLRAISILFVVFYHLKFSWMPSGFVGVDIFFVISGFLITAHLLKDINNACFSLKNFYLKRARRILPALIVVLFSTSIAAYFLFLPNDLKSFAHSLLATLGFSSNLYFWKSINLGYFSTNATIIPLLHTWSLAIEEQFYIFWPILLFIVCRYANKVVLTMLTIVIAALSFILYCRFYTGHSLFAYYSPVTRAFELLLGAILAMHYDGISLPENKVFNHVLSFLALIMIFFSGFLLHQKDFSGPWILLPCIAAVLIILTGKKEYCIGNQLLSNPVLVFFGLISYSLYLWHWPIIAFFNYYEIPLTVLNSFIIFLASVSLSFFTWKLIELPFRFKIKFAFLKTVAFITLIAWLPEISFAVIMQHDPQLGFDKIPLRVLLETDHKALYGPIPTTCFYGPRNSKPLPPESLCSIGDKHISRANVLIVGDSHAFMNAGMLSVFLKNAHLKGYLAVQGADIFLTGDINFWHRAEKPRNQMIMQLIKLHHYKYVVLGGAWTFYGGLSSPEVRTSKPYAVFQYGLNRTISFIVRHHAIPVILLDAASLENVRKTCGFSSFTSHYCYNSLAVVNKKLLPARKILLGLKKRYPSIIFIDPNKIICDQKRCYSTLNGYPLYMTSGSNSHLNYTASVMIGKLYLKKYGNPFR